jgi:pyruvate/2-oxoglutarate dehydrogenase complex dihydrolipoamide dehydrogenase (E3) component
MSIANFDLVVIGATVAAASAATAAAQTHARVAWAPNTSLTPNPLLLLREGSCRFAQLKGRNQKDWWRWTDTLMSAYCAKQSPSVVQSYGVEYVQGSVLLEQNDFWVGERRLRSRTYLLALDPEETLPNILGIDHPKVWTIPHLWDALRRTDQNWPQSIAILGNGSQAVELSQSLRRLGISVLLLTGNSPLLPQEDEEAAFLLQSYLEGSGIQIAAPGNLTAITSLPNGTLSLDVGDSKFAAEALVIATETFGRLPAALDSLNLRQTAQGVAVNAALQTSNPRIYAVGSLLGGYQLPSIALQEAKLAVQNALFERRSPIQYHQIPYAIHSDPPLARVGLTEAQARHHDPTVQILRQNYKGCGGTHPEGNRALFNQSPAGLCKVLVQRDGNILGAHILGDSAPELIHLFALAIQQKISFQTLGELGVVSSTFTEIAGQMAQEWQWLQQHQRDRHERWFYNRRQNVR